MVVCTGPCRCAYVIAVWFATYPLQQRFLHMIREAGFTRASYTNITAGIVAIHSAFKPWN